MSSSIGAGAGGLRLLPGAAGTPGSVATSAADAALQAVVVMATWPTMRAGLRALVEATPGFVVVAEGSGDADIDLQDAAGVAADAAPDVLVIDVDPERTADVRRLLARWPDTATLLLIDNAQRLPQLMGGSSGSLPQRATAVLLRDSSAREIGVALQAALAGMVVLDPAILAGLGNVRAGGDSGSGSGSDGGSRGYDLDLDLDLGGERSTSGSGDGDDPRDVLTERERQVLHLVALGMPNKAIAVELGISEHTAKFHVGAILSKLSAASRAEAVAIAARRGMLSL